MTLSATKSTEATGETHGNSTAGEELWLITGHGALVAIWRAASCEGPQLIHLAYACT